MRTLVLVAALVTSLGTVGCDAPQEDAPSLAAPVVLAPVEVRDLEERLEATGQLLARDHAQLGAEVAGRISRIVFDEGQQVAEGDVILEIAPERRELALASARARLKEAQSSYRGQESDFARVRKLHEQDITSAARLDEAKAAFELARSRVDAARAELQLAERALRDANLRAPFSGRIARRHVSRGEFVNVGQKLVDLVALDPIEVEFHVAERDSARVAERQQVLVRVDAYPEEQFGATVTVISPTIDPRTRTLRVLARVDNHEGRLRPGLFARADLGVAVRQGVMLVPEEAVLQRADGSVVFRLVAESRVERVLVETGAHRQGRVEVRGLDARDQVVTRGHANLGDGVVVSPRSLDGSPVRSTLADAREPPTEAVE